MLRIGLRDVQLCFAYFERMGFKRPTNSVMADDEAEADWLDIFSFLSRDVFVEACKRVVKRVRFWPKPAEVLAMVDEIHSEMRFKSKGLLNEAPCIYDSKVMSLCAKAFKSGEAKGVLLESLSDDFMDFVRSLYPDMSDDVVLSNYSELMQLYENKKRPCGYKLVGWFDKETKCIRLAVGVSE